MTAPGPALRACALALGLVAGCARGCGEAPATTVQPRAPDAPAPMLYSEACRAELDRAAVAPPPGRGALDQLVATCDGARLALWTLRGHTLGRLVRPTRPGAGFIPAQTVSTAADRLGPVPDNAVRGPIAWRAPTAGLDDERDTLWVAHFTAAPDAGPDTLRLGDLAMPAAVSGLGAPAARSLDGDTAGVLAGFGQSGRAPYLAAVSVPLEGPAAGRRGPALGAMPTAGETGELLADAAGRGVSLVRVVEGDAGGSALRVVRAAGASVRVPWSAPYAMAHPRGVAVGGRVVFLVSGFALGGDGCVTLGPGLCVRPGPLSLVVVGAAGEAVRTVAVAAAGLPDGLAAVGDAVEVLYVAPDAGAAGETAQRAASVSLRDGRVTPRELVAPEGMGELDAPTLVACGDAVWIAMGVRVPVSDAGTAVAVTAMPWSCVAR